MVPGKEIFGGSNCLLFRSSSRYNYGRQTDTAAADRRFLSRLSVSSDAPPTPYVDHHSVSVLLLQLALLSIIVGRVGGGGTSVEFGVRARSSL